MQALSLNRAPGWQQRLEDLMVHRSDYRQRPYADASAYNQALIAGAIAAVIDQRSERQDRHLRKELAKWRKRIQGLQSQ